MWDLSSPTRDRTRVPCIGRRILYHWTTREAPEPILLIATSKQATARHPGEGSDRGRPEAMEGLAGTTVMKNDYLEARKHRKVRGT